MRLDSRLRSVVNEIVDSKCCVDVGTDHGKVIVTALIEGRTDKGIATDISKGSLDKAVKLAETYGIPLDTRLGDGLKCVDVGEADTCVIAGMGGLEIIKILTNYSGKFRRLILVPHRDSVLVRGFLQNSGYNIVKDYKTAVGHFYYDIIVSEEGHCELSEAELIFGKNDITNNAFCKYISMRKKNIEEILSHDSTREELVRELELIKEKFDVS